MFDDNGVSMRFGEMLRQARSAKGMTQAELGDGAYSSRFISLLEHDQRQPTPAMVQHFAERLGMDARTLTWWVKTPMAGDEPALTLAVFAANNARDMRDNELAAAEAEHAATIAHEQRNGLAWWLMSILQAQSLITLRRLPEAEAVLLRMEASTLLPPGPELRVIVLGRLSLIARSTGRLAEALELAQEATLVAEDLSKASPARLQTAFILIAALAVKGDLDEAWEVALGLDMTDAGPSVPSVQIAQGAWAIGNIAFRRGDVAEGKRQHDLAGKLLVPEADLQLWSDFHRASASIKVQAGLLDESVRESIRKAEVGLSLVGTQSQLLELKLTQARVALTSADLAEAERLLKQVIQGRDQLDFEIEIELECCLGQYYVARKSRKQAEHHLSAAARLYTEAGADEKARELLEQVRALGT